MSTTELDFPPVDEAMIAKAAKTAATVAVVPAEPITDLAKLDLTTVALAQYGDWRTALAATKANLSTLVLDLSTPTKIKEARTLRARLIGDPLASVRKVAAGIKSKMAQTSKALGAELEKIEAGYAEADALILPAIEKREAELEAEREAKAKAEAERKAKHEAAIATIRACVARAEGLPSQRIANGIAQLEAMPTPTTEGWQEFAVPAANAICETLDKMRQMHAKALADEAREAEAERVRKENEELRARLAAAEAAAKPEPETKMDAPPAGPAGDGSQKPNGEGMDSPAKAGHEYTQDGTQQVLKAEAATPDATDRAPTSASPRVGAMGAGQPADAGPAGEPEGGSLETSEDEARPYSPPAASTALPWPDPTDADLADPEFDAIWQVIKSWDIGVHGYIGVGYCGGNGSHVMLILNALRAARGQA